MGDVNREAYVEAREILEESIDFVEFYESHADSGSDLESTALVPCVIHDESLASFKYFPETESFYCFGCGAGGSVVDLYYHLEKRNYPGMTKHKAVLELSRMYNIKIPDIYDSSYVDESKVFNGSRDVRELEDVGMSESYLKEIIDRELDKLRDLDYTKYLDIMYLTDTVDLIKFKDKKALYESIIRKI